MKVMQPILANKIIAYLSQINRNLLLFLLPSLKTKGLCWSALHWERNHIFSNLEGGSGVLPRKILKTNKAWEAISVMFLGQFYLQ